jgi:hypothetical protein
MTTTADQFEERYARWKAFVESHADPLSSSDADSIRNPEFDAMVALGEPSIPHILRKLRTDDGAHFLVHALERITGHQFAEEDVRAAQRRHGAPLGNQGYAEMWQEWWRGRGGADE